MPFFEERKSKQRIKLFFTYIFKVGGFLRPSQTWCRAKFGWWTNMRGPLYRMTFLTFSFMSGR